MVPEHLSQPQDRHIIPSKVPVTVNALLRAAGDTALPRSGPRMDYGHDLFFPREPAVTWLIGQPKDSETAPAYVQSR